MNKQLKKWTFRLIFTGLFLIGLLVTFVLSPILLYANKTLIGNYSIYHNKPLDKNFLHRLDESLSIIKTSELYNPELKMDICLKDGSKYPELIERIMGRDLLSTFYNKIVFAGDEVNFEDNYISFDGHKWNLTEMLAHAQVHCLEFSKYGLWDSNPIGKHPEWKWEGYPEYIARQTLRGDTLSNNIKMLLNAEKVNQNGWMKLTDNTETTISYFEYRLLIQYCLEIKKMSFTQLLQDSTQEETIKQQMMDWYHKQSN